MNTHGVVWMHDSFRPHTANFTQLLQDFDWEQFKHSPHILDLGHSDLHLFSHLKSSLWPEVNNDEP